MLKGFLILTGYLKDGAREAAQDATSATTAEYFSFPFRSVDGGYERCAVELLSGKDHATVIIGHTDQTDLELVGKNFLEIARQLYFSELRHIKPHRITWKLRLKPKAGATATQRGN